MILRKVRIALAAMFFIGITLLFVDFTGTAARLVGWMAKVQFLPALLALNVGVVISLIVLTLLLGRIGLLTRALMRKYRRHAIVLILIVAAIITPTSDIFTLLMVSIPMYLLYQLSVRLASTK